VDADLSYEPRARRVALSTPTGSGEMAFLDFGRAERPVDAVFLHANGFNARTYRTILSPLADRLRILAPDQRGHGATKLPTDRPRVSWNDMKEDLLALLDAMGLERVALAGHSMGGTASLLAAAEAPARVRALALFDPVIRPPGAHLIPRSDAGAVQGLVGGALKRRRTFASRAEAVEAYRGRGAFRTWTEAMLEDYVAAGFVDSADGSVELACTPEWEVSNYANQDHDAWAAFEASVCPIHILRAASGSPGRLEDNDPRLTGSGRIRVETVPDTTHFLPMERPDLVRAAIIEAVKAP
jgi:pimeloyl-ACP methyl ester carboxylesterase